MTTSLATIERAQRSDNPLDWMYDNPLGSLPNFTFGILKASYQGHPNSALEFGLRKLRPVVGQDERGQPDPHLLTAYRYGVVLPKDAPDELDEAIALLASFDKAVLSTSSSILIYVTLAFPKASKLHHCWEEGRAFGLSRFAVARRLPVLICQHRPGDAGSDNPVHLHLLISSRRLDGTGYRGYAKDLLRDDSQKLIFEEWREFRRSWRRSG